MTKHVEITLTENSTAGNPPKTFKDQSVEIDYVQPTSHQSADGKISIARHNSKVLWAGGKAKDLANITDVKIAGTNGEVLLNGEVNSTFNPPRDTANGVQFEVLSGG